MSESQKDKREYELSFMLKDREGERAVESLLSQHGAEVFYKAPLVDLTLAYPIKKQRQAAFGFVHFRALPDSAERLMQSLRMNASVLRSLLITPPIMKAEKTVKRSRAVAEKAPEAGSSSTATGGMLTNQALEETLEEILK